MQKSSSVESVVNEEKDYGLESKFGYEKIWPHALEMKIELLKFLINARDSGKVVAGYGAAAKGNTFLNYAGIDSDLIAFVVDAARSKQSKFLPGSHIPVHSPEMLSKIRPDMVLILPWNIADEVLDQNRALLDQGIDFYVAVPSLRKLS
jgi:hypothetical protein